ncbi:MAG: hypothetical protein QXD48_02035 [Candidatus Aenigmatarchaeota archaeon]
MGAFIVFRRCAYIGECVEYKNREFKEVIISHFEKRLSKYNPNEFPRKFSKLVNYLYQYPKNFLEAFKNNEEWAKEIARYFYNCGRNKMKFEKCIKSFRPKFKESELYKKEALDYVNGKLIKEFEKMIK